ncbi:MAG: phage holin family protein [Marmoricola sp.]
MLARLRSSDLVRMAMAWAISSLSLIAADQLLSGMSASSPWSLVAAAAVTGIFGVIIRPVLITVATAIGWLAVAALAIAGQAIVMHLALLVVPGVEVSDFWTLVAATWIAATVGTFLTWLATAGTDDAFVMALRRFGQRRASVPDPEVDGVVFVQLDGVPFPVARWALQSGTMPNLRRWVDSGGHRLQEWTVQLPCTTPASQQGILHGSCAGVPAFRWYDRELGRVLVANRPADAAIIEDRASNGLGLLADDGVSISNLFSGDAPISMLTMSRVKFGRGSKETRKAVARFVLRPDGLARSLGRTTSEAFRERFQARQQNARNVIPRVHRSWTFAFLRAVSNGVMRDLNMALVGRQMLRGAHSIYVDFVDYDEIAHHAGGNRIEALSVLEAMDQVLGVLETLAKEAPRRYHFVVLSDHGQSQGMPFEELTGTSLGDLCSELTSEEVVSLEENVESWGRVESVFDDLAGAKSPSSRAAAKAASRIDRRSAPDEGKADEGDLVVLGSGNLGLVYARGPERLVREEIAQRWPRLLPGLATAPGIGFVAVQSREHGHVAIGPHGEHRLDDGEIVGVDPLEPFGAHAPRVLLDALRMAAAPDIYVNSAVDEATLEINAFEDLVGAHGGLGGWQDRGLLIAPTQLLSPAGQQICGAEELHQALVSMLVTLGQRASLSPTTTGPTMTDVTP